MIVTTSHSKKVKAAYTANQKAEFLAYWEERIQELDRLAAFGDKMTRCHLVPDEGEKIRVHQDDIRRSLNIIADKIYQ